MQKSFLFILVLISNFCFTQTDFVKRKSIYFELAGSGGLGSLNYENSFFQKNKTELSWRAGLSFAPIDKNNGVGIVFPILVNSLIGQRSHKLELGLGQGFTITTKGQFFMLTNAVVGYRFQSERNNWFYRISYTPLISYIVDFQVQQWAGISIGYTFKKTSK